MINASWSFYEPTTLSEKTTSDIGGTLDAGDIIIYVDESSKLEPIVTSLPVRIDPKKTAIIKGNYFGDEQRINSKVLLNGEEIENIVFWSDDEIHFELDPKTLPYGTIEIIRGNYTSGLVEYITSEEIWESHLEDKHVTHICKISNDEFLVATTNGIFTYENQNISEFKPSHFKDIHVHVITKLDDGRIAVGTDNNGLFIIDKEEVQNFNTSNSQILENDIYAITEIDDNKIWLGYRRNGIQELNGNKFNNLEIPNLLNANETWVIDIEKMNNKTVYIATIYHGLIEFKNNKFTQYNISNSSLPSNNIRYLTAHGSKLWIASVGGGIINFDGTNFEIFNSMNSDLPSDEFRDVVVNSNNEIWFGSKGEGLVRYNGVSFESWSEGGVTPGINDIAFLEIIDTNDILIGCKFGLYRLTINYFNK